MVAPCDQRINRVIPTGAQRSGGTCSGLSVLGPAKTCSLRVGNTRSRRPYNEQMPRRLKLTLLQRDILVMLEEAGSETVGTVIATLKPAEADFAVQVDQLEKLGLIFKEGNELVLTREGRIALVT